MRDVLAARAPRITVGDDDSTSPACRSPTAKASSPSSSARTAVSTTRASRSAGATASPVTGWGGLKTMSSSWKRTSPPSGGRAGGVAGGDLRADQGDDVAAEVDRVVEQVVPARGDDAH